MVSEEYGIPDAGEDETGRESRNKLVSNHESRYGKRMRTYGRIRLGVRLSAITNAWRRVVEAKGERD